MKSKRKFLIPALAVVLTAGIGSRRVLPHKSGNKTLECGRIHASKHAGAH